MEYYHFEVYFSRYSNYNKTTTNCTLKVCQKAENRTDALCNIIEGASLSSTRSLFYDVLISVKSLNG